MKPSVHLIRGLHITAADKRNILAGIDFLEGTFSAFIEASPQTVPNYADIPLTRKGSPKSYSLSPRSSDAGAYDVVISERYKNDYGVARKSSISVVVQIDGRAPLYMPNYHFADTNNDYFSEKGANQ